MDMNWKHLLYKRARNEQKLGKFAQAQILKSLEVLRLTQFNTGSYKRKSVTS